MTARGRRGLAAAAALAALAGHLLFWYGARERTGSPSLDEAATLLADPAWDLVVWTPYPHQNLGALERRVGDVQAWAALLAQSADKPAPRIPRFGPWSTPPATEWVIALREGGAVRAAARVYPAVALLARLSGWLAGNPWLAGGDVPLAGGRRGRVEWRGRIWRLASADAPESAAAGMVGELPPALAWVRLARPVRLLPAGLWAVRRAVAGGVVAELGAIPSEPVRGPGAPGASGGGGVAPAAAWIAEVERGPLDGPSALIVWEEEGSVEGLPSAALLGAGGARPYRIPGLPLARLAGLGSLRGKAEGLEVTALDPAALALGLSAAPWLRRTLPGPTPGESWRSCAAGVDPARARGVFWRAARHLEALPIVGPREARRLDAVADLLAPWTDCGELVLEVWRDPDAARVVFCAGPAR